jgi:pSer/pThr/pTyr-binding forkhead associated (FHA) protein
MVSIMVMSGVDDGMVLNLDVETDGRSVDGDWILSIGRREENDICLRNDTFVSRDHAQLRQSTDRWWLIDNESKNGTFLETDEDDSQVIGRVPLQPGQLFRIGRTWLRLQTTD